MVVLSTIPQKFSGCLTRRPDFPVLEIVMGSGDHLSKQGFRCDVLFVRPGYGTQENHPNLIEIGHVYKLLEGT
jgi:hypothetical protein